MNGHHLSVRASTLGALLTNDTVEERVCRAYETERDTTYRYLVSLGVGPADAQELTQEVFLRLYVASRRGEEIQTMRAWLFTVASRLALNLRRDESRRPIANATDDDRALDAIAIAHLSPELALLRREQLGQLRDAIRNLSPQQQVCLHLRAEGFR